VLNVNNDVASRPGSRPAKLPLPSLLLWMAVVETASGVAQSYFFPLLPALGVKAGIGTADQNWIYVIQTISMAVLTPILSRLGDMFGCRRVLRLSVATVAAGTLAMPLWPRLDGLTIGAALQGAVVAFMPLLIGILRASSDDREHTRRGIGVLVGVLLVSLGFGGIVSGQIGASDPDAGLWVGFAVAVLALFACALLPKGTDPERGQAFDTTGLILLTLGLVGTVLAIAQGPSWGWTSVSTPAWGGAGLVAMAGWAFTASHTAQPLVAVRLFADRRITVISIVNLCLSASTIGTLTVPVTFLAAHRGQTGYGFGMAPNTIGWVSLLSTSSGFVTSSLTAPALRRFGDRVVVAAGGALSVLGFGGLAAFHSTLPTVLFFLLVTGFAGGTYQAATRTLIVEQVPEHETAMTAGVNELVLSYGAAIGAAGAGAIFAASPLGGGAVTGSAYSTIWYLCAGLGVLSAAAAFCLTPPAAARPGTKDGAPAAALA
jgi:MFS family permease